MMLPLSDFILSYTWVGVQTFFSVLIMLFQFWLPFFLLKYVFIYFFQVVFMCLHVCHVTSVRFRRQLCESVFFLQHVGSTHRSQVKRLCSKCGTLSPGILSLVCFKMETPSHMLSAPVLLFQDRDREGHVCLALCSVKDRHPEKPAQESQDRRDGMPGILLTPLVKVWRKNG